MKLRYMFLGCLLSGALVTSAAAQQGTANAGYQIDTLMGNVCSKLESPKSGIDCGKDRLYYSTLADIIQLKAVIVRGYEAAGETAKAEAALAEARGYLDELKKDLPERIKYYASLPQKQQ